MLINDHMKAAEHHEAAARAHRAAALYRANGDNDVAYDLAGRAHDQSATAHAYSIEASRVTAMMAA